jgi:hypothetical protein
VVPGPTDDPSGRDGSDVTLASYEAAADKWLASSTKPGDDMLAFLDQFAELISAGTVLELGSGPGWDAAHLETRGLRVVRTDGTQAFVERLRRAGHAARRLDVRTDDFGGPMTACSRSPSRRATVRAGVGPRSTFRGGLRTGVKMPYASRSARPDGAATRWPTSAARSSPGYSSSPAPTAGNTNR